MGRQASGDRPPGGRADIYWRRRVGALAVGLAVAGLIAWAVNGTLSAAPAIGARRLSRRPGTRAGASPATARTVTKPRAGTAGPGTGPRAW